MTEGTDLRLVPAALSAWLACWLGVAAPAAVAGWTAAGTGLVTVLMVVRAYRRTQPSGAWTAALALAATCAVLSVCTLQLHLRAQGVLGDLTGERAAVTVVGTVRSEPVAVPARPGGWDEEPRTRFELDVDRVTGRGRTSGSAARVVVLAGPEAAGLAFGSTVRADGRLAPTRSGERAAALLLTHRLVEVTPPGGVDAGVARLRSALLEVTDGLPADQRGLVPGAAIGDTRRVPEDLATAMRHTGLTHITAVSGGHFSVLAVTALGLTSVLRLPVAARAATGAAVMTGFVLLVHPEPSVVRAAGMGGLAMVALLLGRPSRAVPALAATVVVLLLLDPWLARTYGFVLSVVATAAIVLLAPPLARRLGARLPRPVALLLAVPVAAQAACGPVLVLLDPAVLPYAVVANALAAPALVPATVLGTVATVLAPAWPEGAALPVRGAGAATWWIAVVARGLAAAPGAHTPWPAGVGGALLLAVLTAVGLAVVLRPSRRAVAVLVVCGLVVAAVVRGGDRWVPGVGVPADWDVVVCDVGQGDALLVRSGPQAAVMVDVGPDDSAARCLAEAGVRRLDLLVLTHPHADHVGGLSAVLAGREVALALVSPVATAEGAHAQVRRTLERAGVPTAEGVVGAPADTAGVAGTRPHGDDDGWVDRAPRGPTDAVPPVLSAGVAGTVRWEVLGPAGGAWPPAGPSSGSGGASGESSAVNDASVVVLLDAGDLRVLALGDLEPEGQEHLLRRLRGAGRPRPAEVVKIAHHGSSRQSAELAGWLAPAVGVVSAGADNSYGHPATGTLHLYRAAGAHVVSTDRCGRIALTADPRGVLVSAGCADVGP